MGTISIEHSDRLYWLGRYAERAFTTLGTLQKLYDKMIDNSADYQDYLNAFGLNDIYGDKTAFIRSFLYDTENQNSVAYSLERAYDNGIVLREEISTEALSFLQMAKDSLKKSELSSNTRLSLLPLKDILYSFWGCIMDNVYDEEVWNLIFCGKSMERVALYLRLKADFSGINQEFNKLCRRLRFVPKGTPYRCNQKYLCNLVEILEDETEYKIHSENAMHSLEHLFEVSA
ncbi:MAG: alpha-E domain-containing protein [Oscillospiraceae bacterium]